MFEARCYHLDLAAAGSNPGRGAIAFFFHFSTLIKTRDSGTNISRIRQILACHRLEELGTRISTKPEEGRP